MRWVAPGAMRGNQTFAGIVAFSLRCTGNACAIIPRTMTHHIGIAMGIRPAKVARIVNCAAFTRVAMRVAVTSMTCVMSAPLAAQPAAPDTLFGIRLGVALEQQFGECPKNEKGEYGYGYHPGPTPCWKEAKYGKEVKLSSQVLKDSNAYIDSSPYIKTRDGVVVEIDVSAHRDTWRQAEGYLLQRYGKPEKTETYEMDSRVSGLSRHRAHTWRANGVSLYFTERAGSDNARIRAVNDAWEKTDAAEREEMNNRLRSRGGL